MSTLISTLTSNYQLVILILMFLIMLISIATVYFVTKLAVYHAVEQAIEDSQLMKDREKLRKTYVMTARLYQMMKGDSR